MCCEDELVNLRMQERFTTQQVKMLNWISESELKSGIKATNINEDRLADAAEVGAPAAVQVAVIRQVYLKVKQPWLPA